MNFKRYYILTESVYKNWHSAVAQSTELQAAIELMDKLNQAGYEALIVGGAVRDLILGKIPNDVDLTTNARPEQVDEVFSKYNDISKGIDIGKNKAMGVSVVPYKGFTFEIATYRTDVYANNESGKGADKVELTTSFKDDASRRDLTINQIGIDKEGNIIDHHGGLQHIENKIISTVGDPNLRFKEDQVRTLRAIRFASRLGFDIDQKTIDAIKSNAPEIQKVAKERIYKELWKMSEQTGEKFANAILMLREVGLLQYILPEVLQMKSMKHSAEHHPEGEKDEEGDSTVFGHVIEAIKTYKGTDPLVNWSILLHDIGKNNTHAISDKGTHSYHGHAKESTVMIEVLAKRLTLPNDVKEAVKFAAENHMKVSDFPKMGNAAVAQLIRSPYFNILMDTSKADWMARGSLFDEKEWQAVLDKIANIKEKFKNDDAISQIKKVINGKLVMDLTGLKPSKQLGDVIDSTVDYILNNELSVEDDIDQIKQFIKNQVK